MAALLSRPSTLSITDAKAGPEYKTVAVYRLDGTGHALAAGLASATTTLISYPLDLIKTRFQVHDGRRTNLPKYRSVFHAFGTIYRTEGFLGLYAGMTPAIIGSAIAWAAYMFAYSEIKDRLHTPGEKLKTSHILTAGAAAGALTALATNPIWVIKTRMQVQLAYPDKELKYTGFFNAIKSIYASEGIRAFYKGLLPAMLASYHSAVQFLIYENVTGLVNNQLHTAHPGSVTAFLSGGLSKIGAMFSTQPLAVLKARLQEQRDNKPTYSGFVDCIKKIFKHEGLVGFYKGLSVSVYRLVLGSSLFFLLLEQNKQLFLRVEFLRSESMHTSFSPQAEEALEDEEIKEGKDSSPQDA